VADPRAVEARDAWLSATPPADPLPALRQWLAEARAEGNQPNPDAVALATADADGRPAARMVLCRAADWERGWLGFYTNLEGGKARALAARPAAALLFHWDALGRQARVEGPVTPAPDDDADAYFATRPRESQLAAWASAQGQPVASRAALLARYAGAAARFGGAAGPAAPPIPRPPHWGGYRVWAERVELWVSRPHRLHDRVAWSRRLAPADDGFRAGPWRAERLMP
jgi:pyridoxamine 5'-phosphate oxidase